MPSGLAGRDEAVNLPSSSRVAADNQPMTPITSTIETAW